MVWHKIKEQTFVLVKEISAECSTCTIDRKFEKSVVDLMKSLENVSLTKPYLRYNNAENSLAKSSCRWHTTTF